MYRHLFKVIDIQWNMFKVTITILNTRTTVCSEPFALGQDDLHFFTIGCGALMNTNSAFGSVLDFDEPRNVCFDDSKQNDQTFCHFHWATKTYNGAYGVFTTTANGITVEYIESDYDRVLYRTFLNPRQK